MNEFLVKFKEIWKNPRYHALIILGLYFIFFGVIFAISKMPGQSNITNLTNLEKLKNKTNYNFEVLINDDKFVGTFSYDKTEFNYQNIEYNYIDGTLNPTDFKYKEILEYVSTSNIYNLIKDKDVYSKTEYNDGTISKLYKLDDINLTTIENEKEIYEINVNDYKIQYLN